jgi:hypothetical protein
VYYRPTPKRETPDQRRRRWQREQREYLRTTAAREQLRRQEQDAETSEAIRLATRTQEQVQRDLATEARIAQWHAERLARHQADQAWLDARASQRKQTES